MVMRRWEPFRELRRMEDDMNRLWRAFGGGNGIEDVERWAVPLDVVEEDNHIMVKATLPGVKPEDIEVTMEEGILAINAETKEEHEEKKDNYLLRERRSGKFHRTLRLPDTVDSEKAESRYEHGILTISFPKAEAKKARRLEVKAG